MTDPWQSLTSLGFGKWKNIMWRQRRTRWAENWTLTTAIREVVFDLVASRVNHPWRLTCSGVPQVADNNRWTEISSMTCLADQLLDSNKKHLLSKIKLTVRLTTEPMFFQPNCMTGKVHFKRGVSARKRRLKVKLHEPVFNATLYD